MNSPSPSRTLQPPGLLGDYCLAEGPRPSGDLSLAPSHAQILSDGCEVTGPFSRVPLDVRVSARREMSRWFVTFYNNTEEKVFSKHADVKNSNTEHQDTFRLKTPEVIKVEEKLLRDVLEP